MNLLSSEVQRYMLEHNLSQSAMAKDMGIDQSTLSRLIGGSSPKPTTIDKLAKVMNRDARELWCLYIDRPLVIPSPDVMAMVEGLRTLSTEQRREALRYIRFLKDSQE